jgi:hypothetical protein
MRPLTPRGPAGPALRLGLTFCRRNRDDDPLPALPYGYDQLEPTISGITMRLHYDKHHRAYVTKTNDLAAQAGLGGRSLEEIICPRPPAVKPPCSTTRRRSGTTASSGAR